MIDKSKGLQCGGYTHEIIYIHGPMFNDSFAPVNADLSDYKLNEISETMIEM